MSEDSVSKTALGPENPWPGLNQFVEAHVEYFHGRDEEKAELFRLVKYETLTTLFGRSGLGKSSLLQAGLFPLLRQAGYLPVFIHIRYDDVLGDGADTASPLVSQVYAALREACAASNVEAPEFREEDTLWEYFHRAGAAFWDERNRLKTPVLVFDQFEEAFTIGAETSARRLRRDAFFAQLEELIENRPPKTLRERWDRDPELVAQFEEDRTPCKIVLSLREDFLPDLEQLKGRIRSIMGNRFRLERMDGSKAWQVVMGNGAGKRDGMNLVDEEVALKIIDFVSRTRARRDEQPLALEELRGRTVDPALLSVVCSELNNRRRARNEQKISFTLLSENKEEIIREFFDTHVNGLGPGAGATRRFIEEELITEGEGYRKRCALEEEMLRQQNVRREDLRKLEQQRILRFEPSEGITWIELTHDLLTGVVRESRRERRAREEKEVAEKKAIAERERIEGEQRERRKRRWRRGIVTAVAVLLASALGVAWKFNNQATKGDWYRRLIATEKMRLVLTGTPPDMARAYLMAESAENYHPFGYHRLEGYPYKTAVEMLGELPVFAPPIEYRQPQSEVTQAAFSPDGNYFATSDAKGNFWMRRPSDLSREGTPEPFDKIASFCFHPYGKPIVALRLKDTQSVILYDYEKKQEICRIELQGVPNDGPATAGATATVTPTVSPTPAPTPAGIAFSPDGRLLAVAVAVPTDGDTHVNNGSVKIYSAEDGTEVAHTGLQEGKKKNRKPPDKPITAIAFVWIGRTLQMVIANAEGVWVWPDESEPRDSELKGELRYENLVIRGITKVFVGAPGEDMENADADTPYYRVGASAGGQTLCISPYRDANQGVTFREPKVWPELLGELVTGDAYGTHLDLLGRTTALACAPDGQLFAIGTASDGIYIYRHESLIQRIKLERTIISLSFRADGKVLAAVSTAKGESGTTLSLFSLTSHGEAAQKKRSMVAETIAISQNGHWLATLEGDRIRLCDAVSGEVVKEKRTNNFRVTTLTVSDEGEVQALALDWVRRPLPRVNTTTPATVWNVFGNDNQRQLEIGGGIDAVSGDGKWLVNRGKHGAAIEVMNLANDKSKPVVPQSTEDGAQRQMKQDRKSKPPSRRTIAISHSDQVIAVYESGTGKIELYPNPWSDAPRFTNKKGNGGLWPSIPCAATLESLAFGPDDQLLFATARNGDLLIIDLVSGEQQFLRHGIGRVTAMATSVSPPLLAMAVDGQPVCVWGEASDREEMERVAGVEVDDVEWKELEDDKKKAHKDKPLEPMDKRTAAFWDAFWVTGRRVAQFEEKTASVADLEKAYAPLRAVLSDKGAADSLWEMKAMRERLKFWEMLAQPATVSAGDLARLRAALPGLEANERRIVERSGILSPTRTATVPAPGGY